jgi:hypothetical protein
VTRRLLRATWWIAFPAFTAPAIRVGVDRACGDVNALLPPSSGLLLALAYLAGYVWILAAYLLTVQEARRLIPTLGDIRQIWSGNLGKLGLMVATLATEFVPASVWRLLPTFLRPCG